MTRHDLAHLSVSDRYNAVSPLEGRVKESLSDYTKHRGLVMLTAYSTGTLGNNAKRNPLSTKQNSLKQLF